MGDVTIDRLTVRLRGVPAGLAQAIGTEVGRRLGAAGLGTGAGAAPGGVGGVVRVRVQASPGDDAERLSGRIVTEIAAHLGGGV